MVFYVGTYLIIFKKFQNSNDIYSTKKRRIFATLFTLQYSVLCCKLISMMAQGVLPLYVLSEHSLKYSPHKRLYEEKL